jgi:hypothetical protein
MWWYSSKVTSRHERRRRSLALAPRECPTRGARCRSLVAPVSALVHLATGRPRAQQRLHPSHAPEVPTLRLRLHLPDLEFQPALELGRHELRDLCRSQLRPPLDRGGLKRSPRRGPGPARTLPFPTQVDGWSALRVDESRACGPNTAPGSLLLLPLDAPGASPGRHASFRLAARVLGETCHIERARSRPDTRARQPSRTEARPSGRSLEPVARS